MPKISLHQHAFEFPHFITIIVFYPFLLLTKLSPALKFKFRKYWLWHPREFKRYSLFSKNMWTMQEGENFTISKVLLYYYLLDYYFYFLFLTITWVTLNHILIIHTISQKLLVIKEFLMSRNSKHNQF